jgi:hypothetical protein
MSILSQQTIDEYNVKLTKKCIKFIEQILVEISIKLKTCLYQNNTMYNLINIGDPNDRKKEIWAIINFYIYILFSGELANHCKYDINEKLKDTRMENIIIESTLKIQDYILSELIDTTKIYRHGIKRSSRTIKAKYVKNAIKRDYELLKLIENLDITI